MLSWIFRALRLGGVLTSPRATPSGLQMTPPSLPGTENPGKHGSLDFILILQVICITRLGLDAYTITLTCTNLLTHTAYGLRMIN